MPDLSLFFGDIPLSPPTANEFQTTLHTLKTSHPELVLSYLVHSVTFHDFYLKNQQQYELLISRTKVALEQELAQNNQFKLYSEYWQRLKEFPASIHQAIILFSQFKAYSRIQNKNGYIDIEQQELFQNRFQLLGQIKQIFPFDDVQSLLFLQEEVNYILQNFTKTIKLLPSKNDIEAFIFSSDYQNSLPDHIKFFYSPFEDQSIKQRQTLVSLMAQGELYDIEMYGYFCCWVFASLNSLVIGQLVKLRPKNYHAASFFPNLLFDLTIQRAKTLQSIFLDQTDTVTWEVNYGSEQCCNISTFYSTGSSSELVPQLDHKKSYLSIDKKLNQKNIFLRLPRIFYKILKEGFEDLVMSNSEMELIAQLHGLIFRCEGSRNIAALLQNVIFLEVVERKSSPESFNLAHNLPMAMKGAVRATKGIKRELEKYSAQVPNVIEDKNYEADNNEVYLEVLRLEYLFRELNLILEWDAQEIPNDERRHSC